MGFQNMLKKHFLISAIALGLSSTVLANGSMAAPVAAASCPVSDYSPGIYVGLQGGWADSGIEAQKGNVQIDDSNYPNIHVFRLDVSDEFGVAGRVFVGYDINKYFAVETGYFLTSQKTKLKADGLDAADIRTQAIDLVGKLKAPIMNNFGLYAKLGPGYLMQHYDGHDKFQPNQPDHDKFDVVYGAGAYYTFASNWTIDLSWTRYNSGETKTSDDKWQPNVDFYALGISYKFNMPV